MAQKRRRKKNWRGAVLLFVVTPLVVWFVAFLSWFFWQDVMNSFMRQKQNGKPPTISERRQNSSQKPSGEKILDEDRKKLEDIIKQTN